MATTKEHDSRIVIEGDYTTAEVLTANVDEACVEQLQEIVDHEAFPNPIEVMPDAHAGAGAVIGFTMPLAPRIVPNTVGVDIGCGMTATRLEDRAGVFVADSPAEADEAIRERVPLGRETFGSEGFEQDYHLVEDFPWGVCEAKVDTMNERLADHGFDFRVDGDYGPEYFKSLCRRVGYDVTRAINSVGTLGGGNHFIEVARHSETGEPWVVVHSGSRGIGLAIAEHWQERAHRNCDDRADWARARLADAPEWAYEFDLEAVSDADLLEWLQGGKGKDWKDTEAIRQHREGEAIARLVDSLRSTARQVNQRGGGRELDYLDGGDRAGYLRDMVFAQTYASINRERMCRLAADALGAGITERVESVHNYIDPHDLFIRKGATRAYREERGVIPFNMRDGSVLVSGSGEPGWNFSAPHGAGRRGSRRWAHEALDVDGFVETMDEAGVHSSSVGEETLDEAPGAYKDHEPILGRIDGEAVTVEAMLEPVLNIKAEN